MSYDHTPQGELGVEGRAPGKGESSGDPILLTVSGIINGNMPSHRVHIVRKHGVTQSAYSQKTCRHTRVHIVRKHAMTQQYI